MNHNNKRYFAKDSLLTLYLRELSKFKPLKSDMEAQLAVRIHRGDRKALDKLVRANLRFVVSVASNYQNQGMPLADLINEGNLGLIRAARRFDEKKKFRFISYAVWWIRQAILQALAEQSRIVRLPLNRVNVIQKIGKAQMRLEQEHGRPPNAKEIADELEISEHDVREALKISERHLSLDAPLQDGEDVKILDYLSNDTDHNPAISLAELSFREEVNTTLEMLSKREREVIKYYFGIEHERSYTLEEIGQFLNLTRERIRQIKEKALIRIKKEIAKDNGVPVLR